MRLWVTRILSNHSLFVRVYFMWMFTCMYVMYTMYMPNTCGDQRMDSEPLKLGLQVVLSICLGAGNARTLHCWTMSPTPNPAHSGLCYYHSNFAVLDPCLRFCLSKGVRCLKQPFSNQTAHPKLRSQPKICLYLFCFKGRASCPLHLMQKPQFSYLWTKEALQEGFK